MPKSKQMCSGCHQDYYNNHADNGCWMWEKAKIVTRMRVGIWQNPPYTWSPRKYLSCYQPQGSVLITKDDCRVIEKKKIIEKTKQ